MTRETMTARLLHKELLSEPAQCYRFQFGLEDGERFEFAPGQFISAVAEDPNGKQQTRAYSLASAPAGNRFELCVNRVQEGFFSNRLADLSNLEINSTVQIHGPHGHFTLREPVTDSILVATGTGIAPMRGFTQWLFPADGPDRSQGREIWLLFGTRRASELYFRAEFEELERRFPNFHYLPTLSRPEAGWSGLTGHVQDHLGSLVEARAARLGHALPYPAPDPETPAAALNFDLYAYICGLNEMVSAVRERLSGYGLHKKQIVFERYD